MFKSPVMKRLFGDKADAIIAQADNDPAMLKRMMDHWEMIDNMKNTDKKGYEDYIQKMKSELEGE